MLGDRIRSGRTAKGFSQEQLAARLHVVRQTISKWENGVSLPDADQLLQLSQALDMPVGELLGVLPREQNDDELASLRSALASLEDARLRDAQAGKIRGLMLLMSFASMFISLTVQNAALSILLSVGCILASLVLLYRHIPLLTAVGTEARKLGAVKITTVFDIALILLAAGYLVLRERSLLRLTQEREKLLAFAVTCAVMLFGGWVSPRLPYSRHTGLRLPWTVMDEQTWNAAHRVLGYISLPLTLLYAAAAFTIGSIEAVTAAVIVLWVGIPGAVSFIFWWKKFH